MKKSLEVTLTNKEYQRGTGGYKVIHSNVKTENIYAVCTPVKMQ